MKGIIPCRIQSLRTAVACFAWFAALHYPGNSQAEQYSLYGELQETQSPGPDLVPTHDEHGEPIDCQPIFDEPLTMLTVDIEPVDRPGQIDLNPSSLPPECPAPVMADVPTLYAGFQPPTFHCWPIWPGAQFCHRPLYFEEACVERCGYTHCCQPVASAAHFLGSALLLPLSMCQLPPGSCMCTPPPF